ncbi:MAG: hypothetical protein ACJASL_000550 [Paraglaciecola sp.]|jgi:hypothetical protein
MKTKTDTTSTTKSKAAANTVSSRKDKGGAAVQIDDKRQQTGKITQLQEMANSSPGVAIQRAFDERSEREDKFKGPQRKKGPRSDKEIYESEHK